VETEIDRIIAATTALAESVSDGTNYGGTQMAPPAAISRSLEELAPESSTLDHAVCAGVTMVIKWCELQRGPGAMEWPILLQRWFDDWQGDFRRSDSGNERAGYARLLTILRNLSAARKSASVVQ
jgi:hypothetical protein